MSIKFSLSLLTKDSNENEVKPREGHKYKTLGGVMTGENSRVRRINTSSSDDEIRINVRKSQDYHATLMLFMLN